MFSRSQEMFPEATGDISSEKFDPAYFLLEHHHNTAFDDLKAGLEHLRHGRCAVLSLDGTS